MGSKKLTAYQRLLCGVHKRLLSLEENSRIQLTSVAKAIEKYFNEKIRIFFCPLSPGTLGEMDPAMTVAQVVRIILPGRTKQKLLLEHFLLYNEGLDARHARFAIGHELGHIYLHHDAYHRRNPRQRYVPVPLGNSRPPGFTIKFTPTQEREADLFAGAILQLRPAPIERPRLAEPCIRFLRQLSLKEDWFQASGFGKTLPKQGPACKARFAKA